MQSLKKERLFWWVTVPVLVVVLASLAVLQYRWSGQISAATREQMQSHLHTSLLGFREDLRSELSAVALDLRNATGDPGNIRAADLARQFRHWQSTAPHPGLVEHVYVWERAPKDGFFQLDTEHDQLQAAEWPASFEEMRHHLLAAPIITSRMTVARHSLDHARKTGFAHRNLENFVPWMVAQEIPALVYPIFQRKADTPLPSANSWLIVELNTAVMEKEIFPELAQKYFRSNRGVDYNVAVLSGKDHILYSSDSTFNKPGAGSPDDQMNLFGPPFRRGDGANPQTVMSFYMKGPGSGRPAPPDDRRGPVVERNVRLESFPYSGENGYWQVLVKHQRGSLEAAVAGLHRRNLMISYGVLVLLALTMALVVIASQRTRRLAALQMDFVAGVSHELRTPLAVISSAAENIAHGVVSDRQQLARYGSSILKQARQLNRLVEQVLVFAATQQKHGNYRLTAVNITEVIDAALENTSGMASAAGITIERTIEAGLPPAAADFGALSQCLQNLITNAIKYGSDGQWIGIRAEASKTGDIANEIELTVEDHGAGISPQEIKHIFEPFYRSPSVAGSSVHGTGLGLPLARTVIEAMRGRLTVKSEPGKGSSFTIHLAVMPGTRLAERDAASDSIPGETAGDYS